MNDQPDGAQRTSLRGGDGSINMGFQQQPPPVMGQLVPTLNAYGSPCVPYNAHANSAVVDLPSHSPEEMNLLVAQADAIAEQEKQFPILLYKHRTNIDKLTVETSTNFNELMNLIRAEMEKTNDTTTIELLSLLQGEFNTLSMCATGSEATMSKNFDDYKNMLYDQFGKIMTLERANLHNALAIWRDRYQHEQQKALNQQVKISQDVANSKRDLITNLQQQVSKSSMRLGLVLAEKKEIEGKIRDHEQILSGHKQLVASHEQAISDLQHASDVKTAGLSENNAQLVQKVQEQQQQIQQLRSEAVDLSEAHYQLQEEHQQCADPAEVNQAMDELEKVVDDYAILSREKDGLEEKHQALQAEHQFCAEYAEKVKNLPDIWELRTEVVHLKQENARLVKKIADMKSEHVANTQVADEFAGLAAENGLTPMASDVRSRYQAQKLQSQLTASAARNGELMEQIKTLEATNATLEDTLRDSRATPSVVSLPSILLACDTPAQSEAMQSEAMTQELSDLSELVVSLDDKNAGLEQELSEYKSDPLKGRVERLQGQLEIYKKLVTKDRSGPREILDLLSGTQIQKLVKSGLHRHNPTRAFVSETYFIYSQIVKERMEQKVRQDSKKPNSHFGFDTVVDNRKAYTPVAGEKFPDESEITWDPESDVEGSEED